MAATKFELSSNPLLLAMRQIERNAEWVESNSKYKAKEEKLSEVISEELPMVKQEIVSCLKMLLNYDNLHDPRIDFFRGRVLQAQQKMESTVCLSDEEFCTLVKHSQKVAGSLFDTLQKGIVPDPDDRLLWTLERLLFQALGLEESVTVSKEVSQVVESIDHLLQGALPEHLMEVKSRWEAFADTLDDMGSVAPLKEDLEQIINMVRVKEALPRKPKKIAYRPSIALFLQETLLKQIEDGRTIFGLLKQAINQGPKVIEQVGQENRQACIDLGIGQKISLLQEAIDRPDQFKSLLKSPLFFVIVETEREELRRFFCDELLDKKKWALAKLFLGSPQMRLHLSAVFLSTLVEPLIDSEAPADFLTSFQETLERISEVEKITELLEGCESYSER